MEHILTGGENSGNRVIITVLGKDRVGIISGVSTICAENGVNILDISQTILQGFFTMVMVVDISKAKISFADLKAKLEAKGQELGLQIKAQHEDVFQFMHRI